MELDGLLIEYNQIINHCKEKGIGTQDGYTLYTKRKEIRRVDPDLFARTFPEENAILVRKQAAFIGTELDKLVQSRVLPSINVKDAEELVGKIPLMRACILSVSEKISVVKEGEE